MTNRQTFLLSFLGALGAKEIKWSEVSETYITGTVIYEIEDPEEVQDFKWVKSESKWLDNELQILIDFIFENNLLDIDRIKILVKDIIVPSLNDRQKNSAFEKLFAVRVPMIDEDEETDFYFIHE